MNNSYNNSDVQYLQTLKYERVADHLFKITDKDGQIWYDYADEACLFSGVRYATQQQAQEALNRYIEHLG